MQEDLRITKFSFYTELFPEVLDRESINYYSGFVKNLTFVTRVLIKQGGGH